MPDPPPAGVSFAGVAVLGPVARRPDDGKGRIARSGHGARWIPALPVVSSITAYRLYANSGAGDPINYDDPIATVESLTYLTSALTYPGAWSFGVRAMNLGTGLEEQNVDAAVTMILDSGGNDVTNQPSPPTGPRAFALAGGSIRVEWAAAPATSAAAAPTGFRVYIVAPLTSAPMCLTPTTPASSSRRGRAAWRPGDGAAGAYSVPAATVAAGASLAGSYGVTLAGLAGGVTYTFGVRAYNATGQEGNSNTVSATAVAVGPSAVQSLTAVATT